MSNLPELGWIKIARKYVGVKEIKGPKHQPIIVRWLNALRAKWSDDETAWCGTFIITCLVEAGIDKTKLPPNWFRALDYLKYGTPLGRPAYGCVAIKKRAGGGHVCFVVGKTASGKLVCIGGNQGDAVSYALYSESDFVGYRWYGFTGRPADGRYDLPILSGVTASHVTEA